jgi:hypothetical protein
MILASSKWGGLLSRRGGKETIVIKRLQHGKQGSECYATIPLNSTIRKWSLALYAL